MPAIKLTIVGGDGCCDCANTPTSGCDCSAFPCSRSCRAKAGTAELCGFAEFTSPSTPPKKYLQRRMIGGMTVQQFYANLDCEADCPADGAINAGPGFIVGVPHTYEATVTITLLGISSGVAHYEISGLNVVEDGSNTLTGAHARAFYPAAGGGTGFIGPGESATFDVGVGSIFTCGIQINYIFWQTLNTQCFTAGLLPPTEDSWGYQSTYDQDTCIADTSDGSTRTVGDGDPVPLSPLCGSPASCYDNVSVDESPAERLVHGLGCMPDGSGGSKSTIGTAYDLLEIEDTEQNAVDRAMADLGWSAGSCDDKKSYRTQRGPLDFSFAFSHAEVQLTVGSVSRPLVIGHLYKVTVRFARRELGTSGPFLPSGIDEIQFVAEHTIEMTAWIEIPANTGFETKASGCMVEDIT